MDHWALGALGRRHGPCILCGLTGLAGIRGLCEIYRNCVLSYPRHRHGLGLPASVNYGAVLFRPPHHQQASFPLYTYPRSPRSSCHGHPCSGTFVCAIPFILLHVGALAAPFLVPVTWTAIGLCAVFYVVRMFGITGVYHRYFAHRTYRTSRWFQFVLAWIGCAAMQKGPLWWAGHHRHHHKYSDTGRRSALADREDGVVGARRLGDLGRIPTRLRN